MSEIIKFKLLFQSYESYIGLYEKIDNLSEILELTQNDNFCLIKAKTVCLFNHLFYWFKCCVCFRCLTSIRCYVR